MIILIIPYYLPLKKTKIHCISQFIVHSWTYVAVGHCVCLAIYELGCELGGNSGLIPIVIVIVIDCRFLPFFFKRGTLIMPFFCITIREFGMKYAIIPNYGEIVSKKRKKGKWTSPNHNPLIYRMGGLNVQCPMSNAYTFGCWKSSII